MEYLGFRVTWTGIRPVNNKVEAIVIMTPPNNTKYLSEFIGIVKYYRDMWSKWSHLLYTLTILTSNRANFKWTDVEQKAFDDIKRAIAHYTLLAYLHLNERFDIHTDANNYQLGVVIIYNGKPIALYSRKLTGLQTRYTVTKKIASYNLNLKGVMHNFIRSKVKNIYGP